MNVMEIEEVHQNQRIRVHVEGTNVSKKEFEAPPVEWYLPNYRMSFAAKLHPIAPTKEPSYPIPLKPITWIPAVDVATGKKWERNLDWSLPPVRPGKYRLTVEFRWQALRREDIISQIEKEIEILGP